MASVVLPAPFWPTMASDDAGRDGEVEAVEHRRPGRRRVGEGHVAEADLRRRAARRPGARAEGQRAPAGAMAGFSRSAAATGAAAPSSAQLRPPNAISDAPTAAWAKVDGPPEVDPAVGGRVGQRPEHDHVGGAPRAPGWTSTDRSRSRVASYCSWCSRVRRAMKRSIVQPARPKRRSSLARRRVDGQPVGVVGVALGGPHLVGVAVLPDAALPQQPVRGQPGARRARAAPTRRSRTARAAEASPATISTRLAGDEVHRDRQRRAGHAEVELAGDAAGRCPARDPRGGPCPAASTQASVSRS